MAKVRVGIVGAGFVAELHAEALKLVSDAEAVAFAAKHGVAQHFRSHDDLLRAGGVDMITIACPNDLHAQVTIAAAAAGVHVVCEKPLCLNLREADEMIAACQRAGVKLMYAE